MIVSYKNPATPNEYKCKACKATGVKLWRQYQTFNPKLLCGACVLKEQEETGDFDEQGFRIGEYGKTDQCGWYVPAIPDEEGHGYWGYTSVPQDGVDWWRNIPTVSK